MEQGRLSRQSGESPIAALFLGALVAIGGILVLLGLATIVEPATRILGDGPDPNANAFIWGFLAGGVLVGSGLSLAVIALGWGGPGQAVRFPGVSAARRETFRRFRWWAITWLAGSVGAVLLVIWIARGIAETS